MLASCPLWPDAWALRRGSFIYVRARNGARATPCCLPPRALRAWVPLRGIRTSLSLLPRSWNRLVRVRALGTATSQYLHLLYSYAAGWELKESYSSIHKPHAVRHASCPRPGTSDQGKPGRQMSPSRLFGNISIGESVDSMPLVREIVGWASTMSGRWP